VSRGLGDVYKRQVAESPIARKAQATHDAAHNARP